MRGKTNKMIYDFFCPACLSTEMDVYVPNMETPHPCTDCAHQTIRLFPNSVHLNLSSSDLGQFEMYQPAFGKYCRSKREVMAALKDYNTKQKEIADTNGTVFKETFWDPEPSKEMKQMEEYRKAGYDDVVNAEYAKKKEEVLRKDLDKSIQEVSDRLETMNG